MGKPEDTAIDEQLNLAYEQIGKGESKYPGMTYEEGVRDTIAWIHEDSGEPPMEED